MGDFRVESEKQDQICKREQGAEHPGFNANLRSVRHLLRAQSGDEPHFYYTREREACIIRFVQPKILVAGLLDIVQGARHDDKVGGSRRRKPYLPRDNHQHWG